MALQQIKKLRSPAENYLNKTSIDTIKNIMFNKSGEGKIFDKKRKRNIWFRKIKIDDLEYFYIIECKQPCNIPIGGIRISKIKEILEKKEIEQEKLRKTFSRF